MKRKILIGVLAIGTLLGFGSGFASLHHGCDARRDMAEHLSRVCVDSAMESAGREGERAPESGDRTAGNEWEGQQHGWRGRHLHRMEHEVRDLCAREGRRHARL